MGAPDRQGVGAHPEGTRHPGQPPSGPDRMGVDVAQPPSGHAPALRPARSRLSVPGSNWSTIEKAVASAADVAFIDLEDSVAPGEKAAGRQNVIRAVESLDWGGKPPGYRANGLDTPFFYRDLIEIVEAVGDRLSFIVIPKVRRGEDLYAADLLLTQIELNRGFEPGRIRLEALIESAEGLLDVRAIARATPRLQALIFGPGDFAASVHMPASSIGAMGEWDALYPGHRFHHVMVQIVVVARAAGLEAIDGPLANFRDLDAFRRSCLIARSLGFGGKWCIHPGQIPIANDVFSPTKDEIAQAQRIVDAYQQATAAGAGVISLDNAMIDVASIRMAETTLDLARQIGTIS